MEWEDREESTNVEDRRGSGGRTGLMVGGGGIVVLLIALFFGVDPQKLAALLGQAQGPNQVGQADDRPKDPAEDRLEHFAAVIFGDTERVWDEQFRRMGKTYEQPHLVVFKREIESGCGLADSGVGPFYCPADSRVYIDLAFYKDLEKKLNAPGEFARAYVLAHEVGHHVQRLLGYSRAADRMRASGGRGAESQASVRLELQADYLAGVWAHHGQEQFKKGFLQPGDIESALNAASQIGDDKLQKQATGRVRPDSFTHGTSKQRVRWFSEGFKTGSVDGAKQLFELPYNQL
jgi:predicted metalloprotease